MDEAAVPPPGGSDWQVLIDAMPHIVWIADPDGRIVHVNERWSAFTGLPLDDGLGDAWRAAYHPDDQVVAAAAWQQGLRSGEPRQVELRQRRFDGVYRWMLVRAQPIRDAAGVVSHWLGTCTDIDDLKRTRADLDQSRRLQGIAGAAARVGGWTIDVAAHRAYWSDTMYDIYELEHDTEVDLDDALDHYLPEHRARLDAALRACIDDGTPFDLELALETYRGTPLWVRAIGEARPDADGRVTHLFGALQDITAQRRAHHSLQERLKELQGHATISHAAQTLTSAEALAQLAAESLRTAMQHPHDMAVEVTLADAVGAAGGEIAAVADGSVFREPIRVGSEQLGAIVLCDITRAPLLEEEESLARAAAETLGLWLGRHRATAALHAANEQLNAANAQLAAAARLKDDLLSMASHELRTPLTPIIGFLELFAARADNLTEAQRRSVDVMQSNANRMLRLVDDLLVISRATAEVLDSRPEDVEATDVLAPVLDELGERFAAVDVSLDGCHLHVDPQHLQQIVINLVTNAVKYGEPPISITAVADEPGFVAIEVADHGPGIPADFRERMWNRFEQKDRGDTRTAVGVGLGLAIVRLLAEANNGAVTYRDATPSGAVFVVTLPGHLDPARNHDPEYAAR